VLVLILDRLTPSSRSRALNDTGLGVKSDIAAMRPAIAASVSRRDIAEGFDVLTSCMIEALWVIHGRFVSMLSGRP
jgi:hypothetical protein